MDRSARSGRGDRGGRGSRRGGRGRSGPLMLVQPDLGEQSPVSYDVSSFLSAGETFSRIPNREFVPLDPDQEIEADEFPTEVDHEVSPVVYGPEPPPAGVEDEIPEVQMTTSDEMRNEVPSDGERADNDELTSVLAGEERIAGETEESGHAIEVPDFTVGELAAGQEPAQSAEPPAPTLPAVETVLGRTALAANLVDSGLLEELGVLSHETIVQAGPYRLVTAVTHRVIDPYTQLVFAVIGRHYSNLPAAPYHEPTLLLLHYIFSCFRGRPARVQQYESILNCYQDISGESLDQIVNELAQIIIRPRAEGDQWLANLTDVTDFNDLVQELNNVYPEVVVTYNMVYQIVTGSVSRIQNIPTLVPFHSGLCTYLNTVAVGTGRIRASDIRATPRPLTFLPTPAEVTSGVPIDSIPSIQADTQPRVEVARGVTRGLGSSSRSGRRSTQNQLLSQGNPPPVQVQRDTTAFRQSVENLVDLESRMSDMAAEITNLQTANAQLTNEVRALTERVYAMDLAFTTQISRFSQADLNNRINVNRTLVPPTEILHHQTAVSAPLRGGLAAATQRSLIERIERHRDNDDATALARDVKAALISAGDENAAGTIKPESFKRGFSRARICERLRSYPSTS